ELIKKIRKTNNLTQASFGKIFQPSVTQSTVARWEKGEQIPDKVHFPKIASLLDLSFEELLQLIEEPSLVDFDSLEIENKTLTHNKRHLAMLKKGAVTWNRWREKNPDVIPQLSGIKLFPKELRDLSEYNLDYANLASVTGTIVSFKYASLVGANLEKANFRESNFEEADLRNTNLKSIVIQSSQFKRANLQKANLQEASIRFSNFTEVNLEEANLQEADLSQVDFQKAIFKKANLTNTKLHNLDLREANFNKASLEKATITECSVYGVAFLGTNLSEVKLKNVYISPEKKEGLPIDDLSLAQMIYLHRHNPSVTKKFIQLCQMEEEAVNLANILINKYGEYSYTHGFRIYNNFEYNEENTQQIPYFKVRKHDNCLFIRVYPGFKSHRLLSIKEEYGRIILEINNGIIQSYLKPEDIDILRQMVRFEEKNQKQRVALVAPMIVKILDLKKNNKFVDETYILERVEQEIILQTSWETNSETNSEINVELMRVKRDGDQWKIINSSLSKDTYENVKVLLKKLESSPFKMT
ncbi:MAG: pentapeptide repeat-containing protein, partial [Xenococcaceae cyanobacterium MO_167.B52]|nr:pentapeptide repeat-containing protein [Xenococcaceae cyanobacterium MO_167.B52]